MSTTYVPPLSLDAHTPEDAVLEELESRMDDYGVHTIYVGRNKVRGQETGDLAVVCAVERKGLHAQKQLPPSVMLRGQRVLLDVVEEPQPKDLRLRIPPGDLRLEYPSAYANNVQQRCYDTPLKGGVQIAPSGKNWVGTFGAAIQTDQGRMLLTNEHVSGMRAIGEKLCQPNGRSDWVAEVVATGGVRADGPNYIDAAIALAQRTDGKFAPGTYTVTPSQLTLGRINPNPAKAEIGMRSVKEGRTTGVSRSAVLGVNGTSRVGYDEFVATFRGQTIFKADRGNFSAPGDSGSLILTEDMRPLALLFAGGGGQTIGNPIEYVLDWCQGKFF